MREMEIAESVDRLICRVRGRVPWWRVLMSAVLVGLLAHLLPGHISAWDGIITGASTAISLSLVPGKWTTAGEATREGLRVGPRLIPVEEWAALTYREGKGGGLFAGQYCVVADVSREDAAKLLAALNRIAG